MQLDYFTFLALTFFFFFLITLILLQFKLRSFLQTSLSKVAAELQTKLHQIYLDLQQSTQQQQHLLLEKFNQGQLNLQTLISTTVHRQMGDVREQINHSFNHHATAINTQLQALTEEIRKHLYRLTDQVHSRLTEGFEKTSSTFVDVLRRLTIIDEAQKKITELSSHVVSLQDVLVDKRSRGVFGEVQLSSLITNILSPHQYQMQYSLSTQKRADCILFLPQPTGNIVIDAKFPLENYQKLMNPELKTEKKMLQQQFKQDLQKHIKDIAEKYILPPETAESALMFIPAEAIFAEIHANYPEIITLSQRLRVWLVSPSTLMAVLTTAKAVLKDDETRKHVHIIQQHLQALAQDFQRFEKRMDKLSKHIDLAYQDVSDVTISAKKISQRFQKIDAVELTHDKKEVELTHSE